MYLQIMVENKYLVNNKISSQYVVIIIVIINFVGNDRGQNIFCKSSQGFHTLLLVFWPIPSMQISSRAVMF